jgi:hypothetical protein
MKLNRRELRGFFLAPIPVLAPVLLMLGIILLTAPSDGGPICRTCGTARPGELRGNFVAFAASCLSRR